MIDRTMFVICIEEALINYDKLFDLLEKSENVETYIIQYHNDTALIYATHLDLFVSWYKLKHVGRSLITNIDGYDQLKFFINEIKEDLDL